MSRFTQHIASISASHMPIAIFNIGPCPSASRQPLRTFTKLLAAVAATVRGIPVRILWYLDDILILSSSQLEAAQDSERVIHTLQQHGFSLNLKKSHLQPTTGILHLGAVIDLVRGQVYLERILLRKDNLSGQVIKTIQVSRRASMNQIYNASWQFFCLWCSKEHIDPTSASVSEILEFLQAGLDKGLALTTLRRQVAALSTVLTCDSHWTLSLNIRGFAVSSRGYQSSTPGSASPSNVGSFLSSSSSYDFAI